MKIKLNEKDKIVIKTGVECLVPIIDGTTTVLGIIAIKELFFRTKVSKIIGCSALYLINLAPRMTDEYAEAISVISEKSCNWIFNKLENSDKKVVEFEK